MLQNMSWTATDNLARSQFQVFSQLGEQMRLSEDEQRRVLLLSDKEWSDWSDFMPGRSAAGAAAASGDAAAPRQRRHRLAVLADQHGAGH